MKKLASVSGKWWFFVILFVLQCVLVPFASLNFDFENTSDIIFTTLGNAVQLKMGDYNIYFQILSLAMLIALIVFKDKLKRAFTIYVAVSYIVFAFIQNIAFTEKYGLSVVTVNVVMFLFVGYVWIREAFEGKNSYSFANCKWKYSWMVVLSLFAYLCPLASPGFDFNPMLFFHKNSATAFCLMTPLFLTIMTLNIPRINIVTYRITAIIGVIIGLYNMLSFFNPNTINVGILHIPLLLISLYSCILSYNIETKRAANV